MLIDQLNIRGLKGGQMSDATDDILKIDEVDAYLKAGKRTVCRLAASGQIPPLKLGGTWRFRRGEPVQGFANRNSKAVDGKSGGGEE